MVVHPLFHRRRTVHPRPRLAASTLSCLLLNALAAAAPSLAQQPPVTPPPTATAQPPAAQIPTASPVTTPFNSPVPMPEVAALLKQNSDAARLGHREDQMKFGQSALALARKLSDRCGEAVALRRVGMAYASSLQYETALDFTRQSLLVSQQIADKHDEAFALSNIGAFYSTAKHEKTAFEYLLQSLQLFRQTGDSSMEATTLANLAANCRRMGQADKALNFYQQSIVVVRRNGDVTGEANALNGIGGAYLALQSYPKALEAQQAALTLARKLGNRSLEATNLIDLGETQVTCGRSDLALPLYQQAIHVSREISDKKSEALALAGIGDLYCDSGQFQKALESGQEALNLSRSIGNKKVEGLALGTMGGIYIETGQYQKALTCHLGCLPLGLSKQNLPIVYHNVGVAYNYLGNSQKAIDNFRQAAILSRELGDKRHESDALVGIANVYINIRDQRNAAEYNRQALVIFRQIENWEQQSVVLRNVADAYRDLNLPRQALRYYREDLTASRKAADFNNEVHALASLGRTYSALGDSRNALAHFRGGISLLEQARPQTGRDTDARSAFFAKYSEMYYFAIDTLLKEGTPASREDAFLLTQKVKARSLLDSIGSARSVLNGKLTESERDTESQRLAECSRLNRQMVAEGVANEVGSKKRFAQDKADLAKAEQALSTYQDSLYAKYPDLAARRVARTDSLADISKSLPADAAVLEFVNLKADKVYNERAMDRMVLFVVTRSDKSAGARADVRVFDLGKTSDALAGAIRKLHDACSRPTGDYTGSARQAYTALLGKAAGQIAGKRSLIICPDGSLWQTPFAALMDASGHFLIESHDLTIAYSATGWRGAETVRKTQIASAKAASDSNTMLVMADPDFRTADQIAAAHFGNTAGVAGQRPINVPDRPINVPDRPINVPDRPINVPDRPINQPDRPINVPDRPINVPDRPINQPDRPINVPDRPINVPDRGVALVLPGDTDRANAMRPLPGTRREANAIALDFPDAKVLTGADAQEATFKKLAPSYRFIHLATHGFFNDASPLLSSLVLAAPPATGPGSEEDGLLTARELLDLDLSHCELAVLSACNTGVGEQKGGEGIVGLTWSLLAAGCPSQVVSGWPVSDSATVTLMTGFYTALKKGQDKASALRSAELALRKAPATSHPYYWAPFFLVGEAQ